MYTLIGEQQETENHAYILLLNIEFLHLESSSDNLQ